MKIAQMHSHLGGHEHLLVHMPDTWQEIVDAVESVTLDDASFAEGQSPTSRHVYGWADGATRKLGNDLRRRGWHEGRVDYWETASAKITQSIVGLPPDAQLGKITECGGEPIATSVQMDFVKDRIAVGSQFEASASAIYDLFVKHMALFVGDVIDVGVEILPVRKMHAEVPSGVAYYEGELYNILRHGRSTLAVPLVVIGVAP